jgi:hypothetical protein
MGCARSLLMSCQHMKIDTQQTLSRRISFWFLLVKCRQYLHEAQYEILILLHVHPLLGNGLVIKFPRRQILDKQSVARLRNNKWGCVFYIVRATPSAGNGPINSQSYTWHVVFVGSVPKNYKRFHNNRKGSPQKFLVDFRGSRLIEQEMARWLHSDWRASFPVEIRCQETKSEDGKS